jgi:nuclear RNA export factor
MDWALRSYHSRFFQAFDTDRSALVPAYAPHATLSYNLTTTAPRRKIPNVVVPAPGKHSFDTWTEHNRNLVRIGKHRRVNTLVIGDEAATRLSEWLEKTVPRTQHPLHDPTKWMYDVLPLDAMAGVGRIMLTIHGEFLEGGLMAHESPCTFRAKAPLVLMPVLVVGKQLVRSFSRTMILADVQPGTP